MLSFFFFLIVTPTAYGRSCALSRQLNPSLSCKLCHICLKAGYFNSLHLPRDYILPFAGTWAAVLNTCATVGTPCLFHYSYITGSEVVSHYVFICLILMSIFSCAYGHLCTFFGVALIQILWPFFKKTFYYWIVNVLYIFCIQFPSPIYDLQLFSPIHWIILLLLCWYSL